MKKSYKKVSSSGFVPEKQTSRKIYALVLALCIFSALMFTVGYTIGSPSISSTVEAGSLTKTAKYVVFPVGITYYALNGDTGEIDYSGTNAITVWDNVRNNGLTSGRTWQERVVLRGNFSLSATMYVNASIILDLSEAILLPQSNYGDVISTLGEDIKIYNGIIDGKNATNQCGIAIKSSDVEVIGTTVKNLFIDGTTTSGWGIMMNPESGNISNVRVIRAKAIHNMVYGIGMAYDAPDRVFDSIISECIANDNGGDGISPFGAYNCTISDNTCSSNGAVRTECGIGMELCQYMSVVSNQIDMNGSGADGIANSQGLYNTITANTVKYAAHNGIYNDPNTNSSTITANIVCYNTIFGISVNGSYNVLSANIVTNSGTDGIALRGGTGNVIGINTVIDSGAWGLDEEGGSANTIMGIDTHDNTAGGIRVTDVNTHVCCSWNKTVWISEYPAP